MTPAGTAATARQVPRYATAGRRALALILDFVAMSMVFFPVTRIVKGTWLMTRADHLWDIFDPLCGVFLVVIIAYFILLEGLAGATIGKLLLRLRVRLVDGGRMGLRQAAVRTAWRLVDGILFNLVGWWFITHSPLRQRLGDRRAGTVVLHED